MNRSARLATALLAGLVLTSASLVPKPWAWYVLYPGFLLASPFWPQGIHSRSGLGPAGIAGMIFVVAVGTFVFWAGLAYGLLTLAARKHRAA